LLSGILAISSIGATAQTAERYLVSDRTTSTVSMYNAADDTFAGRIKTGAGPFQVAVSPNGRLAYVAAVDSNYLSVVDLALGTEVRRVRGYGALFVALTSDGSKLVMTNGLNDIAVMNTATFAVQHVV